MSIQELKKIFEKQGLSKEVICGLLGNIQIESNFVPKNEDMTYTTVAQLRRIWPSKFMSMSDSAVQTYLRNPQVLGDYVYSSFGGYKYRGRGYIQLSTKANYELYGRLIGIDLLNNPDLAATHEVAALISIAWIKRNAFPQWKGDLNRCTDVQMVADTISKSIQGFRKDYTTGFLKETLEARRKAAINFYNNYNNLFGESTSPLCSTVLKSGSKGQCVINLQNALIKKGYKLTADGDFGAITEKAVKDFQSKNGLTVDGIVGPKTWAAIYV